ncbi:MAG: bifunctional phosphoribosylaminoimidazolecarboxamide formyltransferase/IMP cyclohydrolase [Firmicutes bacterium]|nr:bifunctional phosphoribosylaminoimidazolecarboxamide formyltransferase/IMP cyclohydrolase [Bacillota bacterium]
MKKRALISVSDKTGIVEFSKILVSLGFEIISTGGTAKTLTENNVPVISISDITNFPECLDGRVKTLHPNVHAGLLAMRSNKEHMKQLKDLKINTIDVVVVNLYPFKSTIEKPGVEFSDAVENIDIGGPTMLRAAAKNYQDVYVVVDPKDYLVVLDELKSGKQNLDTKRYLMYKVFSHTAVYDTLISNYLKNELKIEFPEQISLAFEKAQDLRYGENPHQNAVFYKECFKYEGSLREAIQLHGKELSYNNINDTNGALDLLREFDSPCVVAVKHANPCGVGLGKDIFNAYKKAYESDPVSIFGGIVAANGIIDEKTAEEMSKIFLEIIIAKGFTEDALEVLKQKQNIRLLELKNINSPLKQNTYDMKKVVGGLLIQKIDDRIYDENELEFVTDKKPDKKTLDELKFAFKVVKHCKSNAIALSLEDCTVGLGIGQTNRIFAAKQAIEHAGERAKGSVLASDAFFPFSDCVEEAAMAGVKAIIQPGGSVRDKESIDACNKYKIAMVFTKMRHFKH